LETPMTAPSDQYVSPLVTRNASAEMSRLFGATERITVWRQLWIALAEAQRELGLDITAQQITALKRGLHRIDFAAAARYEQELRHDVMAHLHAFGDEAPKARGILAPGGDQLLRGGQRRPDHHARGAATGGRVACGVHRSTGQVRQETPGAAHPGIHPLPARPAHHRGQAGVACGATTWCATWRKSRRGSSGCVFAGSRGRPARKPASWPSSTAVTPRSNGWRNWSPNACPDFKLDRTGHGSNLLSQGGCPGASPRWPVWPRASTKSPTTCGCSATSRKSRNRSRTSRSARQRHGLQTQPHADGTGHRPGPLRALHRHQPQMTAAEQWFERTLDDSANKRLSVPELPSWPPTACCA
jgi:hypothetical protein